MSKKEARRLWHDARRFERQTREPGCQDGAIGRNGLRVLEVLLFDFLNYCSGELYPSIKKIASAAIMSPRSAARGLAKLKDAGVLNWLRRAVLVEGPLGGFLLRQTSNAYTVMPSSDWRGYKPPPEPPAPAPAEWGARPPINPYAEAKAAHDDWARLAALDAEASLGSGVARIHASVLRRRLLYSSAIPEAASLAMKPQPTVLF